MSDRIAVSSWALHRTLGVSYPDSPASPRAANAPGIFHAPDSLPLMDLPGALAEAGYRSLQLCHFHIPSRSAGYASEFRAALAEAGVVLHALLIDSGDVTDPLHGERDAAWIAAWLRAAENLGAENARVIAGKQPATPETLARSADTLSRLGDDAAVHLHIENWQETLETPESVNELLDRLEGRVGLCADFGNWPRPRKYADLPKIMPRAEACHAKFEFVTPTALDEQDASACMRIATDAGFTGPYVLVNGGIGASEWDALDLQREAIHSRD